jgi:hypothetical protein
VLRKTESERGGSTIKPIQPLQTFHPTAGNVSADQKATAILKHEGQRFSGGRCTRVPESRNSKPVDALGALGWGTDDAVETTPTAPAVRRQ